MNDQVTAAASEENIVDVPLEQGISAAAEGLDPIAEMRAKLDPNVADYVDQVMRMHTASVMQHVDETFKELFNNPIVIESMATSVLRAGINALDHKARWSTERKPHSIVLARYVPGALRLIQQEDGYILLEQQDVADAEARKLNDGWAPHPDLNDQEHVQLLFKDLLASYDAQPNRYYYVIDDISLQNFREGVSDQVRAHAEALMNGTASASADPQ